MLVLYLYLTTIMLYFIPRRDSKMRLPPQSILEPLRSEVSWCGFSHVHSSVSVCFQALMKDLEDFWGHFLALDLLVSTSEENRNLYDGLVESWQVLQREAEVGRVRLRSLWFPRCIWRSTCFCLQAKRYEKSIAMSNHKDFLKVKMGKEYYEEMIKVGGVSIYLTFFFLFWNIE